VNGARRLFLSGIAVTALLAVVALASRAHRPVGDDGDGRGHVPTLLLEYLGVMGLIVVLAGGVAMVWASADARRKKALARTPTSWRRTLAGLAAAAIVLLVLVSVTRHLTQPSAQRPKGTTGLVAPLPAAKQRAKPRREAAQRSDRNWLAALVLGSVLLGLTVAAAVAVVHRRRHREDLDEEVALARALDEVLADTLDDLRGERDPRKAVIEAYARMERTFAAYRVAREPAETPLEYVSRALDRLNVSAGAVRRLTLLFERAKFSTHAVDEGMKHEAIEALAGLRAELEVGQEAAA
jgi:hypothetical protein